MKPSPTTSLHYYHHPSPSGFSLCYDPDTSNSRYQVPTHSQPCPPEFWLPPASLLCLPSCSSVSLGVPHPLPCPFLTTAQTSAHDHLPAPNASIHPPPTPPSGTCFRATVLPSSPAHFGVPLHPPEYLWLQFSDCEPDLSRPGELGHSSRGINQHRSLTLEPQIPQPGSVLGDFYAVSTSTPGNENLHHQALLPSQLLKTFPSVVPLAKYPRIQSRAREHGVCL